MKLKNNKMTNNILSFGVCVVLTFESIAGSVFVFAETESNGTYENRKIEESNSDGEQNKESQESSADSENRTLDSGIKEPKNLTKDNVSDKLANQVFNSLFRDLDINLGWALGSVATIDFSHEPVSESNSSGLYLKDFKLKDVSMEINTDTIGIQKTGPLTVNLIRTSKDFGIKSVKPKINYSYDAQLWQDFPPHMGGPKLIEIITNKKGGAWNKPIDFNVKLEAAPSLTIEQTYKEKITVDLGSSFNQKATDFFTVKQSAGKVSSEIIEYPDFNKIGSTRAGIKVWDEYNQPQTFYVYYNVKGKLSAEQSKPVEVNLGESLSWAKVNLNDVIKVLDSSSNAQIKMESDAYEKLFQIVGEQTIDVTVTETLGTSSQSVIVPLKVNVKWGNAVFLKGYGDKSVGAVTLNHYSSPMLTFTQGNPTNGELHDFYRGRTYYDLRLLRPTDTPQKLGDQKTGTSNNSLQWAQGQEDILTKIKTFGDNKNGYNQAVYGDLLQVFHEEAGTRERLIVNGNETKENDDQKFVYYEITTEGFSPVRVNQLRSKKSTVPLNADDAYLTKHIDEYIDKKGYKNIEVKRFTSKPETSKIGETTGKILVEETLKSGKKVQWEYEVPFSIKEDKTKLELQDVELYQGDKFDPNMPFKNVTDKDGNKIKAEDFKYYYIYPDGKQVGSDWLTKELDTTEPGTYKVRVYHIESKEYSNEATITVKEDKTKLELQDVDLYQGEKFDPNMPFKNVTDKDGNKIKAEDFKYYYIYPDGKQVGSDWLTKELDTKEPGIYKVRIFHTESREYSNVATITVKEDKTKLELQDVELYQGDKFDPNMPFKNVTDKDGNKIKAEDFKYYYIYPDGKQVGSDWLTKELDTTEPGTYKVRVYHIESKEYSNEATITVKEDKTKLELQDVDLYQGEKFDPNMPFKNVTDKDGNKIKAEDFKYYYIYPDGKQVGSDWLTKELDTKEPGIYKVRVFHIESREYSNVSTVTIKEDKSSLKTKDLTVDVEQKISWKEGFSSATDENGKDIPWSDKRISIEGVPNKETNIDTSKPGVYEYTLIFKGKAKNTNAKFTVTVQEKLSAEANPQTLSLGTSIDRLNPKDFVKNVKKGNEEIKPEDYTVEIKETVNADTVANKTMTVTVVRRSTGEKVDVSVPVKVEWGISTVAYGAWGDSRTSAAFPLILGKNPIIAAVSGLKDDNTPIHSNFKDIYYQFDWFDLSETTTITMDETKRGKTYIEATGEELKQDALKKWGTDQKQPVQYGDIVRAWQREPTKNYLYENGQRNKYNNGQSSVYYEITKDGYRPLKVNQLKQKTVSTVLHASAETLNEDFKNNIGKYFDSNEIKNIKPVKFVNLPDTRTPGLKSAKVRVEETLKTGKKVQYDYDIEVNVENKWVNVTIPTKMLFFSDMETTDKIISESYSIKNNSANTSLSVEMASFSVGKTSGVNYLSEKDEDPSKQQKSLRLNLLVDGEKKVNSLNANTPSIPLTNLASSSSSDIRFEGKYFNDKSEDSPRLESSIILKFGIKD